MHLTIANKLYSSWSLRPWILMRALDIAFEETVIPLFRPETAAAIGVVSPSGRLPVLVDGVRIWDSLAIIEHLHECFPHKGIWPRQAAARAHARAIASEMHAGFQALRQAAPMNLGKRFHARNCGPEVAADVARIEAIWAEARQRFGSQATGADAGPFLFGAFSAADAMYAPVVTRLDTYQFAVGVHSRVYMDAVLGHAAFASWREAALREPWQLPHYEAGWTVSEVFHQPVAS